MLDAASITSLHDRTTALWHQPDHARPAAPDDLPTLVEAQHRANFDLWHEEDKARDPGASDSAIAAVKRSIDRLNQRRNDLVEQIDVTLLSLFQPAFDRSPGAPLHS